MARNTSRNIPARNFVSVPMDTDLLERVEALAQQQGRSRANLIRWLLQRELAREASAAPTTPHADAATV